MRPFRLPLTLVAVVILAAGVAAGGAVWLVATEAGARTVVDRLVQATGSVLTATNVEGTLLDGLRFSGLRFDIERVQATADEAMATIDLRALLSGRVVIRDLFVTPVNVLPQPAGPADGDTEPFRAVDLPVDIFFESVVVAGVNLRDGAETYQFGQLTMTVSYIGRVVDVVRFESTYEAYSFSTQASFDLATGPMVDATLSLAGRAGDVDVLVGARVTGTLPAVDIDAEILEPTPIAATGTVVVNTGPDFDLALTWESVDQALLNAAGLGDFSIAGGTGRVSGQPTDVAFTAATTMTIENAPIALDAAGSYTPSLVTLDEVRLARDAAVVDMTGTVDPISLAFRASVEGSNVDTAWFFPDWDGRVAVTADATGMLGSGWQVEAAGVTLDGVVRDQTLTLTGGGRLSANGPLTVQGLQLRVGANTVAVNGDFGADLNVDVDADLADIGGLADGIDGRLSGTIAVRGQPDDPELSGVLVLADFAMPNVRIDTLDARGQLGIRGVSPIAIDATATGVRVGSTPAVGVAARVSGTAEAHSADFTLTGADWEGSGRLEGSLAGLEAWNGLVAALRYVQPPFGEWRLREPAALAATTSAIALESACLEQGRSDLCLGFVFGGGEDGRLRISATDFDLAVLQPLFPEGVSAAGVYQADIDVAGPRSNPVGTLRIAGGRTELSYARTQSDSVTAVLERVSADARVDLDHFESSAELAGVGTDNVRIELAGTRATDDSIELDGRIDASWADIAPLTILSRHVGDVAGNLTAGVRIGGTLTAPLIDGQAALAGGRLDLPEWGVVAESIRGTARSANGESIEFEAVGQIDGSELRLTGATMLTAAGGWPTQLQLAGDRVPIVQIADVDVVVSPDLRIDVNLPRVEVVGTVDVPEAKIAIASLPEQAVRPSDDSVVYGVEDIERVSPLQLSADIDLRLGDDVRYEGSGLMADLGGALRVRYASETSADASGTLNMTGTYEAFGQELTLERGELVFTGPMSNPNLNVRAVRRVEDITVGIDLTGSLEAPVTRIFSEPLMAEADAVSYLLFGRPLAVPDGTGDPDLLRNAAVSLGLRQAVPVIQRIGDSLGFDDFAIESTEVDVGELMAGKYLSPKLYVRYSYGLFNRIGGLLLQYQLNERISIETRSGDQKSMDILFTIERD